MQGAPLSLSPVPVAACVKRMTSADDVKKVITEIIFIYLRKAFSKAIFNFYEINYCIYQCLVY